MEPVSLESVMIEYWWLLAVYSVGSGLLGWALCLAWNMIKDWWSRRKDRKAAPDVERITGGWRIQDDPDRDWATGESKIPTYSATAYAEQASHEWTPTAKSRLTEFIAQTKPRSPEQFAIEASPRAYIGKHSTDGLTPSQIRVLNTSTGSFPIIRTLNPSWRQAVAV